MKQYSLLILFTVYLSVICCAQNDTVRISAEAERTLRLVTNPEQQKENDTMRVSIFRGIEKFYLYRYDSMNMMRTMDSLVIFHPVIKRYNLNSSLGNIGSSVFSPFYKSDNAIGFRAGMDSRRMYVWESGDIRFVNSHKRYSRVFYVNGSKKENYIEVEHSQSFGKNMDIGFRYNRINSLGYYSSQQTFLSRLNLYGRLSSRNQRYLLLINGALNSSKNQENGGIIYDGQFENDSINNLKFLSIYLTGAQSLVKDNSVIVHQHFDFGKKVGIAKPDQLQGASDTLAPAVFVPKFRIGHEISYRKNFFLYSEPIPSPGYYASFYLDSVSTNDSVGMKNLENVLSFNLFGKSGISNSAQHSAYFSRNYLSFNLRHQYTELVYGANVPDTAGISVPVKTFGLINNNLFVQSNAGISNKLFNKIWFDAAYCITGYNAGDFSINSGLQILFSDKGGITNPAQRPAQRSNPAQRPAQRSDPAQRSTQSSNPAQHETPAPPSIEAKISVTGKEPDYIMQHYISNHFIWNNDFNKIFNAGAEAAYIVPRWKLRAGGAYNFINNLVYFAQDARPSQYGKGINILKAFVQKRFTLGKFNLDNDVTYQYAKQDLPVRLPALVLRSSFFFEDYLFKKALHSRFGFDVYYNTAWTAYAYMPATGQFYVQDTKKTGNYPFIDVYAAFRVKGARFFLKLDHAFAGLLGNTYYGAAHYPLNGRTFKFGVDWSFLD